MYSTCYLWSFLSKLPKLNPVSSLMMFDILPTTTYNTNTTKCNFFFALCYTNKTDSLISMSSPAEPHTNMSGQTPLTARALDQLDAQVADADKRSIKPSSAASASSKNHTSSNTPDLPDASNKMIESDKTRSEFESEISKGEMRLPSAECDFVSFFFGFFFFFALPTCCVIITEPRKKLHC